MEPDCETSYRKLKNALLQKPVLLVADPTKAFVLQTDASNYGLGAVLSHYRWVKMAVNIRWPLLVASYYPGRSGM